MDTFSGYDYLPSIAVNPVPKPAALSAAVMPPPESGGFQFSVQASAVQTTLVQATTDLGDPNSWTTIATNPPGSSFTFTDTNASQFPDALLPGDYPVAGKPLLNSTQLVAPE